MINVGSAPMVAAVLVLAGAVPAKAQTSIAEGRFAGASDHDTSGGVSIVRTESGHVVRLAEDFSLDGAPDPKLGFGNSGDYDEQTTFAVLESNSGEQSYTVPATIDPARYNEFYVWCEEYAVPLGVAKLQ